MDNNKDKVIIALDAANKCGFAIYKGGVVVESGVWYLAKGRNAQPEQSLYKRIVEAIQTYKADLIVMEDVFYPDTSAKFMAWGDNAVISLCEKRGVVKLACSDCGLPDPQLLNAWSAKRFMFPAKNGMKRDMLKRAMICAVEALGYEPETDDEADALGILFYFLKEKIRKQ